MLTMLATRFEAEGPAGQNQLIRVLKRAPFNTETWAIVDGLATEAQTRYWSEVTPNWLINDEDELREMFDRLLLVNRPRAILGAARFNIEKLDLPRIVRLLREVATNPSKLDAEVRFQSFEFKRAFEILDSRSDVSREDLAHLEFLYLSVFQLDERGVPDFLNVKWPNCRHYSCKTKRYLQAHGRRRRSA